MNDDFLYKFRKPPRREFAAALYKRISKPMKTNSRTFTLRNLALAISIVAVATAALFFIPSTRALADTFIRRFGGYIFVQATPLPDLEKKDPSALSPEEKAALQAMQQKRASVPPAKEETAGAFAADATAASRLAGFTVIAPNYIPEGYTPGTVKNVSGGWAVVQENGGIAALISYQNQADHNWVTIEELKYEGDHPKTVERPEIVEVTVRGQPGVWMPGLDGGKNALVWDENGITFSVVSATLQLDELLKVAESLGK